MKISKRTRDAAIHCLEQCASDRNGTPQRFTYTNRVESGSAEALASAAFDAAYYANPSNDFTYLEAAALLRDGWNPGDPVERRP